MRTVVKFFRSLSLPVVVAVVLGIGMAASMYLNIVQHQRADQDRKLLQGQISDLQYQVNQDRLASANQPSPSPTPDAVATPEASPTPAPEASPTPTPDPAVLGSTAPKVKLVIKSSTQPNLRANPSSSGTALISHVAAGTPATLVDETITNGYQHVTIDGKTGYILASYLQ